MNAIILPKQHPADNQPIEDTREARRPLVRMTVTRAAIDSADRSERRAARAFVKARAGRR